MKLFINLPLPINSLNILSINMLGRFSSNQLQIKHFMWTLPWLTGYSNPVNHKKTKGTKEIPTLPLKQNRLHQELGEAFRLLF